MFLSGVLNKPHKIAFVFMDKPGTNIAVGDKEISDRAGTVGLPH